jgi:hypothetical protein
MTIPIQPARLALPADLYVLTGNTLDLVKTSLTTLAPGGFTWGVTTTLAATDTGTIIQVGPEAVAGDYALTLTMSIGATVIDSAAVTVHVLDDLTGGSPTWDMVCCGDSITTHGWPAAVVTAGAGHLVARGTQAAYGPTACEAYSGKCGRWFACDRGAPAGSPWVDADDIMDIPAYLVTLGLTPDVVIIALGTNDIFPESIRGIDLVVQRHFVYYDRLIAKWAETAPGTIVGLATTPPGSTDQADFDTAYPPAGTVLVADWRERQHRFNEGIMHRYASRIVPVHPHIDGATHYGGGDAVHPLASGDTAMGAAIYAWLVYQMS